MIVLIFASIALQVSAQQFVLTNGLGGSPKRNVTRKVVRLDPILRKALLRALSELEKEAQEKAKAEEAARATREDIANTNEVDQRDEIQNTADTSYPTISPTTAEDTTENTTPPATISDTFIYHTPDDLDDDLNGNATPHPTAPPQDIESNLIPEEKPKEAQKEPIQQPAVVESAIKKVVEGTDVDIFKAPLVAAFTLHQDERGQPHSVVPLFRDAALSQHLIQQQQQQQLNQQFPQQHFSSFRSQFIPSVTITPFSHPQQHRFFNEFHSAATPFPPLVSNSLSPSVVPSQSFHISSTVTPLHNVPQIFNPSSTAKSPRANSVSIVPSNNIFPSSTPSPFPSTTLSPPPQNFQPISIPPVTLPLQNEPRFNVPDQTQLFLQNQERLRNQFLIEEQTRQFEDQKRQQEQKNLQSGQKQVQQQQQQQQQPSQQLEQQRPQRQEQGTDFQRSLGFSYNHNQNRLPPQRQSFDFRIQPSQQFVSSVGFQDQQSRNRVNRQEGFGSTGNFGFNDQRAFGTSNNQFQNAFSSLQAPLEYRTIPEELYKQQASNIQQVHAAQAVQFQQQYQQFQQNQQSVNRQLQNLLYQSGVADPSGQEDLNIVSKVLALNHERSDVGINDRRPTGLRVGEIKDAQSKS